MQPLWINGFGVFAVGAAFRRAALTQTLLSPFCLQMYETNLNFLILLQAISLFRYNGRLPHVFLDAQASLAPTPVRPSVRP